MNNTMNAFESKVRQVGDSLGVLIPQQVVWQDKLRKNQTVRVVILKKNPALIQKAFGSARNARPFIREHEE